MVFFIIGSRLCAYPIVASLQSVYVQRIAKIEKFLFFCIKCCLISDCPNNGGRCSYLVAFHSYVGSRIIHGRLYVTVLLICNKAVKVALFQYLLIFI